MKRIPLLLFLILAAFSCDKDNKNTPKAKTLDELKAEVQKNYVDLVYANYLDVYNAALALKTAISTFVGSPTEANLDAAKKAWLAAREPYGQSEAFRFGNGPIDDEDGPEGLINAWPLDESYIDYIEDEAATGIINDLKKFPVLSKELLGKLNEAGGEENISIGYHAIEFLLWGQDLRDPAEKTAGKRLITDFTKSANADRRKQYLSITTDLLIDHLKLIVDAWNPKGSGNYRSTFLALPVNEALRNILTGIGTLSKSELAGERIFTAYDNRDQEDEHSCFSDNTHRDIRLNTIGILNVLKSEYKKADGSKIAGTSFLVLANETDAAFSKEVSSLTESTWKSVDATAIPFDYAISNESTRPQIKDAVDKLRSLGDKIAQLGTKLGITINTELPE